MVVGIDMRRYSFEGPPLIGGHAPQPSILMAVLGIAGSGTEIICGALV